MCFCDFHFRANKSTDSIKSDLGTVFLREPQYCTSMKISGGVTTYRTKFLTYRLNHRGVLPVWTRTKRQISLSSNVIRNRSDNAWISLLSRKLFPVNLFHNPPLFLFRFSHRQPMYKQKGAKMSPNIRMHDSTFKPSAMSSIVQTSSVTRLPMPACMIRSVSCRRCR